MEPDAIVEAVFGDRAADVRAYVQRLATTAVEWGLIGPAEADRLWNRHIYNSVALSEVVGQGATVFDVGSGAGLPGVPLALRRPDLAVVLIEPMLRRSEFLEETVAELGLDERVQVLRARAEEVETTADVVVARAVAPLGRLVDSTAHLFPEGTLLALKGDKAESEMVAAGPILRRRGLTAALLRLQAHPDTEVARAVRVSQTGAGR
jgi:16S rRNA (guanine527-N7)-methyltransferase